MKTRQPSSLRPGRPAGGIPAAPSAAGSDATRWAVWLAAAALFATQLAVDAGAASAFDAPKRLVALLAAAAAAAALARAAAPPAGPSRRRLVPALFAAALGWTVVAALLSPHRPPALDALRALLLTALLVPVGAGLPAGQRAARPLLLAFLAGCTVNAALALAQAAGLLRLFDDASIAGRTHSYGLVGNEGVLALALAFGAVAAAWTAAQRGPGGRRAVAAVTAVLLAGGVLATRNLTGIAAIAVGGCSLALLARGRRALAPVGAGLALLAAAALALPGPRGRLGEVAANVRSGNWDAVLSFRGGPWSAAAATIRDRPLLGAGPGSFAADYVPRRLAAELRARRRFPPPPPATGFSEAHADPLDALAAVGWPGALAACAAAALLLAQLARAARNPSGPERAEATLLFAVLAAGAVAATAWFPLQRAATAVPLLLAAGRGWRIAAGPAAARGPAARPGARLPVAVAAILGLVLATALVPEFRRYAAERRLRTAITAVRLAAAADAGADGATAGALATAGAIADALPGDPRPARLAGGALLLARRPAEALAVYRRANAVEERAENDLDIGRAWALLDRRPEAFAAFVRAAWIAPALLPQLPEAAQPLVAAEIDRLAGELRAGRLASPPPAP